VHTFWLIVGAVVAVAALTGVIYGLRRQHYLKEVRELGWSHDSNPTLAEVSDLGAPPFAMGLRRSIDELVAGTTPGGFSFRVFEYGYTGAGPKYSGRVAAVQLPISLPAVFVCDAGHERVGIALGGQQLVQAADGDLRAIADDAGLVQEVLASVGGTIAAFARASGRADLGVDGSQLVACGAPKDPDDLKSFLAGLDPVAQALAGSASLAARQVPPSAGSGFYGHPDWQFVGGDDSVLDVYPTSREGYGHRVEDLIRGLRDGIRLDAFTHTWKTDHTVTETDSEGHTHTRTVTDHHSEVVCGFVLPFALPSLSMNGRRVGEKVRFESTDFNSAFTVRTDNPRFASDVTHPRMMEWLLATRPYGWSVTGSVVDFEVPRHDLLLVDACEEALRGWLGRFPRFVWQDLGLQPPPFLVE